MGNVLDSVSALELPLLQKPDLSILDVGTGGGFPLLPLAICLPDCRFTGIDATQKKIDAIGRIVEQLGLQNVTLICGRTEELGHDPKLREQFDVVTARALAELNVLLEYASPFAKLKGHVLAWKSLTIEKELEESLLSRAELSCHLQDSYRYVLPDDWGARQILIFHKTFNTNAKYPRAVGTPKKNPLV